MECGPTCARGHCFQWVHVSTLLYLSSFYIRMKELCMFCFFYHGLLGVWQVDYKIVKYARYISISVS